ncbi:AraC family transcriptional regulator [Pseudomonas syringae pv. helianthi]|uniref:AraC family transcriptional regulator n=2 Tax=Pseudomonas syringae group TaxID=136849 RepID=A0A0P9RL22_9PSED|nr:AraC family transcriptional regulator [Pseudomonas syringae pv. helianthi]
MNAMSIYFDTHSIAPRERADFWQEVVCNTFVPLDCAFSDRQSFHGRLRSHSVATLALVDVQSCEQTVVRDATRIARSDDEFVLVSLALEGQAQVSQEGRDAVLKVGDFAIYDTRRPYRLHFDSAFRQTVVQIPRNSLQQRLCNLEYLTALSMSRDNPLNGLVFDFFTGLAALENRVDATQQMRITEQGLDLLAMALSERVKGQIQGSRRSGLLLCIKDHIQANLSDTALSLDSVSARFGVSTRYISSLFQDEETSFGRYLLASRLQRCATDLREPLLVNRQIGEIAWRWGFSDVAHFSRVFRQQYGMPARAYRAVVSPIHQA